MIPWKICFFCGEANPQCIEEHHLIPKALGNGADIGTIPLCANCHKKLHYILRAIKFELPNIEEELLLSDNEKTKRLLDLIGKLEADSGSANLTKLFEISGLNKEEFDKLMKYMVGAGCVYTPDENSVKVTRRF